MHTLIIISLIGVTNIFFHGPDFPGNHFGICPAFWASIQNNNRGHAACADTGMLFERELAVISSVGHLIKIKLSADCADYSFSPAHMTGRTAACRDDIPAPRFEVELGIEGGNSEKSACRDVQLFGIHANSLLRKISKNVLGILEQGYKTAMLFSVFRKYLSESIAHTSNILTESMRFPILSSLQGRRL
jgi:hypothetical protein